MKRFLNGKMRMLSLLLSLVLVLGLIQANAVTASAETTYSFSYAYDCQRSPDFPKQGESFTASSITDPVMQGSTAAAGAAGTWVLTSKGYYTADQKNTLAGVGSHFDAVISNIAGSYNIQPTQVEVYELTKNDVHVAYGAIFARSTNVDVITTFLGDNWNSGGCTYLLSDSPLNGSKTVAIDQDLSTNAPPQHTHTWTPATSGNGTKEATTSITCTDPNCGETLTVTLTASDVTLPGNVFTAQISTGTPGISNYALRAVPTLPGGLTISSEPGYKYSATGSDFAPIDPSSFTPAPGFYQASILIKDGNDTVENLYVTYTVSDPVVTAATGDNRPIEMMVMGMAFFCAMAIAAFVLDSKRRGSR